MNYAQRERLAYIDFCLEYQGQISRADLISRFSTGLASCSRDLALYKELAPENAELKHETKKYFRTRRFKPIFKHDPESILVALSTGFGDGISQSTEPSHVCFDAIRLIHPDPSVIGALMRAIHSNSPINCQYESISSGTTTRTILPHAIVNNGHRWHVRAFDRKTNSFRDFVCTRFSEITEEHHGVIKQHELSQADSTWNNILRLVIEVHPNIVHKKGIEMDYGMADGQLVIECREALVGYLLRQWNVDASAQSSLNGAEYQLKLSNPEILFDIEGAILAPGFSSR